jgi:peptidoglycan hydrolase-like protein with peptidoglycan-binding domain
VIASAAPYGIGRLAPIRDSSVMALQRALRALGLLVRDSAIVVAVDGVVGPRAVAAVNRAFTAHIAAGAAPAQWRTGRLSPVEVRAQAARLADLLRREFLRRGGRSRVPVATLLPPQARVARPARPGRAQAPAQQFTPPVQAQQFTPQAQQFEPQAPEEPQAQEAAFEPVPEEAPNVEYMPPEQAPEEQSTPVDEVPMNDYRLALAQTPPFDPDAPLPMTTPAPSPPPPSTKAPMSVRKKVAIGVTVGAVLLAGVYGLWRATK